MLVKDMDRIIFAGDSITDMGCTKPVGFGPGENLGVGYPRMFDNMIGAFHPELRVQVINAGVSGNTSRDLLNRFEKDVIRNHPSIISIMIGVNDVWRQFDRPANNEWVLPDEYERNLRLMIEKSRSACKTLLLMAPYYMEPLTQDAMRARMDEYGVIVKKLSDEYGTLFIDLQKLFNDYFAKGRHSTSIAWDRVHPNQIGATLIAGKIYETLEL